MPQHYKQRLDPFPFPVYECNGYDFAGRVTIHAADGSEVSAGDVRGEIEGGVASGEVYDAFGKEMAEFGCDLSVAGEATGWFRTADGKRGRLRWSRSVREDEEIRELRAVHVAR